MADEQRRRYLGGSAQVGLVVYTAYSALAMLALDAGEEELSYTLIAAADLWAEVYPNLNEQARDLWADRYEELMATAAEGGVQ